MTTYCAILWLRSLGLNKNEITASLHCARNTVATTLWPLPKGAPGK